MHFEPFPGPDAAWDAQLLEYSDHQVFQTSAWLRFVEETQRATPIRAILRDGGDVVGLFAGLVVRKGGIRILGSPMRGWLTPTMGIRLRPGVDRLAALDALSQFAFSELRVWYLELADPSLGDGTDRVVGADRLGFDTIPASTYELNLRPSEADLFQGMNSACRRCIRKASKVGVEVVEAGPEGFADDYYAQMLDVFEKQQLVPTYPKSRIESLIRHLHPTGHLLLLRALDAAGHSIASGIFPGMNTHMYFLGGASYRSGQINRPNEAIFWYAMRYWKERGITTFDLCGRGDYKLKYGCVSAVRPRLMRARHPILISGRMLAQRVVRVRQRVAFHVRERFDRAAKAARGRKR